VYKRDLYRRFSCPGEKLFTAKLTADALMEVVRRKCKFVVTALDQERDTEDFRQVGEKRAAVRPMQLETGATRSGSELLHRCARAATISPVVARASSVHCTVPAIEPLKTTSTGYTQQWVLNIQMR
jgi:hypothetical protein